MCGKGENVNARHDARARGLDVGFDGVDYLKPADRVQVGHGRFLTAGIEKNRAVATLPSNIYDTKLVIL
jgi:hypothetical protein